MQNKLCYCAYVWLFYCMVKQCINKEYKQMKNTSTFKRGNSAIYKHLETRRTTPYAGKNGGTVKRTTGKRTLRYESPTGIVIKFSKS